MNAPFLKSSFGKRTFNPETFKFKRSTIFAIFLRELLVTCSGKFNSTNETPSIVAYRSKSAFESNFVTFGTKSFLSFIEFNRHANLSIVSIFGLLKLSPRGDDTFVLRRPFFSKNSSILTLFGNEGAAPIF